MKNKCGVGVFWKLGWPFGPRPAFGSHNNAQATSAHLPVRSGGSAQTAFRGEPAIRLELRAARTSLGAYVRLLSAQPHCTLRACAPGHLRPIPRTSSRFGSASKSRFSLR